MDPLHAITFPSSPLYSIGDRARAVVCMTLPATCTMHACMVGLCSYIYIMCTVVAKRGRDIAMQSVKPLLVLIYCSSFISLLLLLYSLTGPDNDTTVRERDEEMYLSMMRKFKGHDSLPAYKPSLQLWHEMASSRPIIQDCPKIPSLFLQYVTWNHSSPLTEREQVLAMSKLTKPMPLANLFNEPMRETLSKTREMSFTDVYVCHKEDWNRLEIKIIPIEGDIKIRVLPQETLESHQRELVTSVELSLLGEESRKKDKSVLHYTKNFQQIERVALTTGKYPDFLLDQWDAYDFQKSSNNPRPVEYPEEQLYIVTSSEYAGVQLTYYRFHSFEEFISIMQQLSLALAVGESALEFEHRNLHRGNVLVRRLHEDLEYTIPFRLDGVDYSIESHGIMATIFNFKQSRIRQDSECNMYLDLNELPWMFENREEHTSQQRVYTTMKEESRDDWGNFTPHSNVLWLSYLAESMSADNKLKMDMTQHSQFQNSAKLYYDCILENQSAKDVFLNVFSPEAVRRIGTAPPTVRKVAATPMVQNGTNFNSTAAIVATVL